MYCNSPIAVRGKAMLSAWENNRINRVQNRDEIPTIRWYQKRQTKRQSKV